MSTPGFNQAQIKQLQGLLETTKSEIIDQVSTGVAEVVESLSETIHESEKRTTTTIRSEIKSEISKLDDKIDNFISITPTKFQVKRLEKAVFGS